LPAHSSLNTLFFATRVAKAAAALAGKLEVSEEDLVVAARLVIAPRATVLPVAAEAQPEDRSPPEEQRPETSDAASGALREMIVRGAEANIPQHLLDSLRDRAASKPAGSAGRAGDPAKTTRRGRPVGVRAAPLRTGARLNVIETLRAAAPWQRLRQTASTRPSAVQIRSEDFRIHRLKHKAETATIFVVDASGSTAIARLAEAKGAIELLLASCYVRRDQVAMISFAGPGSRLLLAPTRALARAKRDLADLPGGGATPLASGIAAAAALADKLRRKGQTPTVVLLTDGRANLALDGKAERSRAMADALSAAATLKAGRIPGILIDTSDRPKGEGARVAEAMGARYLALPRGDAQSLSHAIRRHTRESAP
jgi:magnesium chelatase subunit D